VEVEDSKKGIEITFSKWGALPETKTDEELKQLVKDIDKGLIYTDKHVPKHHDIKSTFMILMFLGGSDKKSGDTRQNKIYNILLEQEKERYYKELGKTEDETLSEFYDSIGMVYEYLSEASPTSVNGQPCFFSCKFLNKEETKRFFVFYEKYMKLKEEMESEFGS
jgi:hypothetical protein